MPHTQGRSTTTGSPGSAAVGSGEGFCARMNYPLSHLPQLSEVPVCKISGYIESYPIIDLFLKSEEVITLKPANTAELRFLIFTFTLILMLAFALRFFIASGFIEVQIQQCKNPDCRCLQHRNFAHRIETAKVHQNDIHHIMPVRLL